MQKGRKENSRGPGDHVQIDQTKGNKLSTTQVPKPLQVTGKYGNEVTMMSPEGVKVAYYSFIRVQEVYTINVQI